MRSTLYHLTVQEAKVLIEHFNNDAGLLGLFLWDKKRASSIERGIYKANKLIRFVNKG